jgi:hypothetical protein
MTVGGWFDAEDLYGPLKFTVLLKTVKNYNTIVMGAESWRLARNSAKQVIGNINFEIVFQVLSKKHIELISFVILKEKKGRINYLKLMF